MCKVYINKNKRNSLQLFNNLKWYIFPAMSWWEVLNKFLWWDDVCIVVYQLAELNYNGAKHLQSSGRQMVTSGHIWSLNKPTSSCFLLLNDGYLREKQTWFWVTAGRRHDSSYATLYIHEYFGLWCQNISVITWPSVS